MKKAIVLYLFSTILLIVAFFVKIIDTTSFIGENLNNYQFNIITINSIFAGFLFTGLSIIISISDSKPIQALIKTRRIQKVYINLFIGICSNLISILFCIAVILNIKYIGSDLLIASEMILISVGIESLIISLYYLIEVIKAINNDYKKISDETEALLKKHLKK